MANEKSFMDHLMIELCAIPGVRVWRQNSGQIVYWDPVKKCQRTFRTGVPVGAADLSGIYGRTGQRIEIETKAARGVRNPAQVNFSDLIQSYHGIYMLATKDKQISDEESAKRWAMEFRKVLEP